MMIYDGVYTYYNNDWPVSTWTNSTDWPERCNSLQGIAGKRFPTCHQNLPKLAAYIMRLIRNHMTIDVAVGLEVMWLLASC